jgi:hypothetical protein
MSEDRATFDMESAQRIADAVRVVERDSTVGAEWLPKAAARVIVVLVEKDGGADGTATNSASWTYTIRNLAGITIAEDVEQTRPRPNGMMTVQAGSNGYGIAFRSGTNTLLWDAGEVPTTTTCTP